MRAPATEAPLKPKRGPVFRALRIFVIVTALLGLAWVVGSVFYDDELPRVQANEGLMATMDLMAMQVEFHQKHARFAEPAEIDRALLHAEPHVTGVELLPGGAFRISYRGRHEIDGKTLTLTPYMDKGDVRWRCDLPDIKTRWWPDYCRPKSNP